MLFTPEQSCKLLKCSLVVLLTNLCKVSLAFTFRPKLSRQYRGSLYNFGFDLYYFNTTVFPDLLMLMGWTAFFIRRFLNLRMVDPSTSQTGPT